MIKEFTVEEGSLQQRFLNSKAKFQIFGGGFANGKTAATCVKVLKIATDYPGSNGLIARSTYPKLNDTIKKEFLKWCPSHWIKRKSEKDNIIELVNGTIINFRYIAQQGKSAESTTSNLLSATYDWIAVDQMEDPEISEKDFLDLMGRLRGSARYIGSDPNMPDTGPRFFIMTLNPTRNWIYRKVISPLHTFQRTGIVTEDLICERDENHEPVLVNGRPILSVELFEGSTYTNKRNLPADFIKSLESNYTGQMRDRFLLGQWAGYEGLIYPKYSDITHLIPRSEIDSHINECIFEKRRGYQPSFLESFDYGIASPSCYLFAVVDPNGIVFVTDGFYEKDLREEDIVQRIKDIRLNRSYNFHIPKNHPVFSDPAIFARKSGGKGTVGNSTAIRLWSNGRGIHCVRGNNDILNGINKVSAALEPSRFMRHPISGERGGCRLYFASELTFLINEISSYYWQQDTDGSRIDKPVDRNDHAMDALKYMLSHDPVRGEFDAYSPLDRPAWTRWHEIRTDGY